MIVFFSDRCQIPYLFISTPSNIQSYNTKNSSEGSAIFVNRTNTILLSFDDTNKRLYSYSESVITSYDLDGSILATINIPNVEFFTVDGQNNVIYYHTTLEDKLQMYDIAMNQDSEIAALSSVTRIKDLDIDMKNGYIILSFLIYLTIRLLALDFYAVIVDEGERALSSQSNYSICISILI